MLVLAKSKREFEDILISNNITDENVHLQSVAFISVLSPGGVINPNRTFFATPYFKREHDNVIIMDFDDIAFPSDGNPFTLELAEKTVKFILANKDKEIFLVHCAAGISRSGAIAMFISDIFECNYSTFMFNNPYIMPNNLVRSLLKEAYEKLK